MSEHLEWLKIRLIEFKTAELSFIMCAKNASRIIQSQSEKIKANEVEALLWLEAVAHFYKVGSNTQGTMISKCIDKEISTASDINDVKSTLKNINRHLADGNSNHDFLSYLLSCEWLVSHYLDLLTLIKKFDLPEVDSQKLQSYLAMPVQRFARLPLLVNAWLEHANKIEDTELINVITSLLSKFLRMTEKFNQPIAPLGGSSSWFTGMMKSVQRFFGQNLLQAQFSDALEYRDIDDRTNQQLIDEWQQSFTTDIDVPLPTQESFAELERNLNVVEGKDLKESIRKVNSYLTKRAQETRTNCFASLFGYNGKDYYERRANWTLILRHMSDAARSGASADIDKVVSLLKGSIAYFSAEALRTHYADALNALLKAIEDNNTALSSPVINGYLVTSYLVQDQLNKLTDGNTNAYQGVVGSEEFLTVDQARETEAINRRSGKLPTLTRW